MINQKCQLDYYPWNKAVFVFVEEVCIGFFQWEDDINHVQVFSYPNITPLRRTSVGFVKTWPEAIALLQRTYYDDNRTNHG